MAEADSFDLEQYASKYPPHGRLVRLKFIASNSERLELEALRILFRELKKGQNTSMYKDVFAMANGRISEESTFDSDWVKRIESQGQLRHASLQGELENNRAQQITRSIQMSTKNLAEYYHGRGDFANALKYYKKIVKVDNLNSLTLSEALLTICRTHVLLGDFDGVKLQIALLQQTPEAFSDSKLVSRVKCYSGLAALVKGDYYEAAQEFTQISLDPEQDSKEAIGETLAFDDIALYGGLCGLATFSRAELESNIIKNDAFRKFLELVPEVREMIMDFYNSEYAASLSYLERMKPDLALDLYLSAPVKALCGEVRSKGLIQYCQPYSSVDMRAIANSFNTTTEPILEELGALIAQGKIEARIDTENKVLFRKKKDRKALAYKEAIATGGDIFSEVDAMLLRMQLMRQNKYVGHRGLASML
uniref:PCI domain-containing protein n=1 Tax=Rhodosorus marinus TaxID=101924 RepID=A0A7S0BQL0_9RHOD|mmetsp:Transcript_4118/g.5849  ORF Transcript_4118/g.5849 Transcript_4118/m.5849 type:complete len:421 (+) Transcript_4118:85-1347(+)